MRPSRRPIIIATRRSRLALAQAQAVAHALQRLHPKTEVKLLPVETDGDRLVDQPLAEHGGKGLFTRSIEHTLLHERADVAVHSLKDLPVHETAGLVLAAIPQRGDVRDCLVAHTATSIQDLPRGANIGTGSPRRAAQLRRLRPDVQIHALRGNIDTRLRRVLNDRQFDATLLATVGLQRAGLAEHADRPIDVQTLLPAGGQGALAIQCRADDHVTLRRCLPLNDAVAAACVRAERQVIASLQGDCHSPIAALAQAVDVNHMRLRVRVLSTDGSTMVQTEQSGPSANAKRIAQAATDELLAQGAAQILRALSG